MTVIRELKTKKDGAALKALALDGDVGAAFAFVDLVFGGKYAGAATPGQTKVAAKDDARADALGFVQSFADSGEFEAIKRWALINFEGVREPGQFGGTIMNSHYTVSEEAYRKVLNHPECTKEETPDLIFRTGMSAFLSSRINGSDRTFEIVDLWESGRSLPGPRASLCAHALADLYWTLSMYEKAVECAHEACSVHPYSHLTLFQAYNSGKGVPVNPDQARHHHQQWNEMTTGKKS